MKSIHFLPKLILMLALVTLSALSQVKLAYVDSQVILGGLPEAQIAQREIEEKIKAAQQEFDKMGKEFQTRLENYQKKQTLMQPSAKEQEEKQLADMQRGAKDYYNQKLDPREGEITLTREKLFAPIRQMVLKAIEKVAREDGFNLVFDKIGDAMLLYADAKLDITYRVLDRLKRGDGVQKK